MERRWPPSPDPRRDQPRSAARRGLRWSMLALLAATVLSGVVGCTRAYYRREADYEVTGLIESAQNDPRWQLPGYGVYPSARSRHFDPFSPDRPPMPPDDPTSNQLMHCVDGKRGWAGWDRAGQAAGVENPQFRAMLSYDERGYVALDRPSSVRVALLNSREYQRAREELYLSALDVSLQRFRFDTQYFGGHSTFFTVDGSDRAGGPRSELALHRDVGRVLELRKRTATGGELVVGLANSLVWQFAGPDQYSAFSLLDFSLVQPLLRAGGRAVALESLTQSERDLLANVRQMERFHHAFYTQVIAGRATGPTPSRGGLRFDPGPFGGASGGILALMAEQVRIRNRRMNIVELGDSVDQLEELHAAGRIGRLQVDIARQSLYNAQSRLLAQTTAYQDRLDTFKILLGLPPELPLEINDDLLAPLNLIDPELTTAKARVDSLLRRLRDPETQPGPAECAAAVADIHAESRGQVEAVRLDFQKLLRALPERRKRLEQLARRPQLHAGEVDPGAYDIDGLHRRVVRLGREMESIAYSENLAARLHTDAAPRTSGEPELEAEVVSPPLVERLAGTLDEAERLRRVLAEADEPSLPDPLRQQLLDLAITLSEQLLELQLVQALARLDTVTLVPVELDSREAVEIARRNRLDWMNARAALVDQWRQIKIAANALRSNVDVTFSGDMGTTGNNPAKFRATTGRLRVGLEVDSPISRRAQRNAYRETLIAYQRARRDYMLFEDRVDQGLRSELRAIETAQLDFELRRAGVLVAITQVDLAKERLRQPPRPGETLRLSDTTARDLVQALDGLLSAQDALLGTWVEYLVLRMALDLDLGTMRLDERCEWIDPGPIGREHGLPAGDDETVAAPEPPELIPLPEPDAEPLAP